MLYSSKPPCVGQLRNMFKKLVCKIEDTKMDECNILRDRIRNERTHNKLEFTLIVDKINENQLR